MMIAAMIFVAAAVSGSSQNVTGSQASQRQKMIHMAAVRIADQIGVTESKRESFVAMYQAYKKEAGEIMAGEGTLTSASASASTTGNVTDRTTATTITTGIGTDPETAAEQKILADFDKSQKILDLRKAYYAKFRTILSPTQIQQMYNAERSAMR